MAARLLNRVRKRNANRAPDDQRREREDHLHCFGLLTVQKSEILLLILEEGPETNIDILSQRARDAFP
jgi:hypothetical protein